MIARVRRNTATIAGSPMMSSVASRARLFVSSRQATSASRRATATSSPSPSLCSVRSQRSSRTMYQVRSTAPVTSMRTVAR